MENVLEFLDLVTEAKGMVTQAKSTANIFTMPMSYVFNKARERFYFIVHIPLTRPEQVMDMFEYIPFPMTMSTSENHVVLPRPGHLNVLALNQKPECQVLASSELSQVGSCPQLSRMTDPENELPKDLPRGSLCQRCRSCFLVLRLSSPTSQQRSLPSEKRRLPGLHQ